MRQNKIKKLEKELENLKAKRTRIVGELANGEVPNVSV